MSKFTIIIPVKSINDYVRETVPYIQALKGYEWELFIISNNKENNEWPDDDRVSILASGKVGPADKRDFGAKKALGDILVFLDDDSYPEENLLEVANKHFDDAKVIAIGGPALTPESDSFWQHVSGAVFLGRLTGGFPERYVPIGKVREIDDWPSVNLMVRREEFLSVGGFNCEYWPGEDTWLFLKLKKTGKKLIYVPEMIVWHHRRAGLLHHLKQIGAYGLHRGYFARHYPETSFRFKFFLPSIFVFFNIVTLFVLIWAQNQLLIFGVVLGWIIYGIALLSGFLDVIKYYKFTIVSGTLVYLPLTHFYYGVRFLRGFLKKSKLTSKLR